jgi:hypothetical protein
MSSSGSIDLSHHKLAFLDIVYHKFFYLHVVIGFNRAKLYLKSRLNIINGWLLLSQYNIIENV